MAADNSSCTAYSKTGGLGTSFRNWNMVCHNYHPCWCTMYLQIPDVVKTDGIQNYLAPSRQPCPHAVLQRYYCRLPDLPLHYSSTIVRCALQTEYRSKHWVLPHNSGLRYNLQPPASSAIHSDRIHGSVSLISTVIVPIASTTCGGGVISITSTKASARLFFLHDLVIGLLYFLKLLLSLCLIRIVNISIRVIFTA